MDSCSQMAALYKAAIPLLTSLLKLFVDGVEAKSRAGGGTFSFPLPTHRTNPAHLTRTPRARETGGNDVNSAVYAVLALLELSFFKDTPEGMPSFTLPTHSTSFFSAQAFKHHTHTTSLSDPTQV